MDPGALQVDPEDEGAAVRDQNVLGGLEVHLDPREALGDPGVRCEATFPVVPRIEVQEVPYAGHSGALEVHDHEDVDGSQEGHALGVLEGHVGDRVEVHEVQVGHHVEGPYDDRLTVVDEVHLKHFDKYYAFHIGSYMSSKVYIR